MPSNAEIFLVQTFAVVCLPYLVWRLLPWRPMVPLVVVQIAVGLTLGPSVLGGLGTGWWESIFGTQATAQLEGLARLAVLLFAFLTGLHLDGEEVRRGAPSIAGIAVASMAASLAAGLGLGLWLADWGPGLAGAGDRWTFAYAVAVCTAVTALPVLAVIVGNLGLTGSPLGRLALGVAAATDAALWVMLAALLAQAGGGHGLPWPVVAAVAVAHLAAILLVVRPLAGKVLGHPGLPMEAQVVMAAALMVASALVSESVGLHSIVGAFVAGLAFPREAAERIIRTFEPATITLLMPYFFLNAGLHTSMAFGLEEMAIALGATAATILGKMGGGAVAARWLGFGWRDALALGALLQTKGLMEIVVLTALLQSGLITSTAFNGLLLMALLTTLLAQPLARLALGRHAPVLAGAKQGQSPSLPQRT